MNTPKSQSVSEQGQPDDFVIGTGWERQVGSGGDTRLLISVPTERLAKVHLALLEPLEPPLTLLYRRKVNRQDPRPNGTPPEDFLAPDLSLAEVRAALTDAGDLIWHDARCEVWVRGVMGEQIILDQDGLLYAYPDDPSFRDVLDAVDVPEQVVEVMLDRDYVKHWYHASADALEEGLLRAVAAVSVAPQGDPGVSERLPGLSELPVRYAIRPGLVIEPNLVLAPMEGVTDVTFRRLIRQIGGCGLTFTEFIPARGLSHGSARELLMAQFDEAERPITIQVFGNDPAVLAEGARVAQGLGADAVDLNMGCPSKRVCAHSGGSALMKEPALVREIVAAMRAALTIPFTVKMRAGWDPEHENAVEIARISEGEGAEAVAVHWRTRTEKYGGTRRLDVIAAVKQAVSVPVLANGDIVDVHSARQTLAATGVDGLMIGRGAIRDPWLFRRIHAAQLGQAQPIVDEAEKKRVLLAYFTEIRQRFRTDQGALGRFKKIAKYFVEGVSDGEALKTSVLRAQTPEQAIQRIEAHFAERRQLAG